MCARVATRSAVLTRRLVPPNTAEDKSALKGEVGKRVRALRLALELTVPKVAELGGVPKQYIYDLEGGVRVSITNIIAAARALGATTDYLLGVGAWKAATDLTVDNVWDEEADDDVRPVRLPRGAALPV